MERLEHLFDFGEIRDPTSRRLHHAAHVNCDLERMSVESRTLMRRGNVRQPMRSLKCEFLEDLHGASPPRAIQPACAFEGSTDIAGARGSIERPFQCCGALQAHPLAAERSS